MKAKKNYEITVTKNNNGSIIINTFIKEKYVRKIYILTSEENAIKDFKKFLELYK